MWEVVDKIEKTKIRIDEHKYVFIGYYYKE